MRGLQTSTVRWLVGTIVPGVVTAATLAIGLGSAAWETDRFVGSLVLALVLGLGAGAAASTWIHRESGRIRDELRRVSHRLREIGIGDDPAVTIDRCPLGHGLWLDQGELRAVLAGNAGDNAGRVAGFLAELYASELAAAPPDERRNG